MASAIAQSVTSELLDNVKSLHVSVGRPALRQLRDHAEKAGFNLPISTAHDMLTGRRVPRWTTVEAFVEGCLAFARSKRPMPAVPSHLVDLQTWRRQHERLEQNGRDQIASSATTSTQRRSRDQRARDAVNDLWTICVTFLLALDAGQSSLRGVAVAEPAHRFAAANKAIHESGVYAEREKLLIAGTSELVKTGESVFLKLVSIRNVVRIGATLDSDIYHHAYHPFAEAMWEFRLAVRAEFGKAPLSPYELDRINWLDHERCLNCPIQDDRNLESDNVLRSEPPAAG